MTFIEPFPIGLAITLISAAVLRKKAQIATGSITLVGILIEPVPASVLLASPSVVVDVHK